MSFVYRSPEEMASAYADKLEEAYGDMLDVVAVTQVCACENQSHDSITTTYGELIAGLRAIASGLEQTEPSFFRLFIRLAAPIMNDAEALDQDPLDVLAKHTFRDEGP